MRNVENDILLGEWATENESGIHVLYGSIIRFETGGKGTMYNWGGGNDENDPIDPKYEYETFIEWERVSDTTIRIRKSGDPEWTILDYVITDCRGAYGLYDKLISTGNHATGGSIEEWFWNIPEALYRHK